MINMAVIYEQNGRPAVYRAATDVRSGDAVVCDLIRRTAVIADPNKGHRPNGTAMHFAKRVQIVTVWHGPPQFKSETNRP